MCEPSEEIISKIAVIYGHNPVEDPKAFCKIKTQDDLIASCVDAMFMVPPHRNFTIKVFLRTLRCLKPDFKLSSEQSAQLIETLTGIANLICTHVKQNGP